MDKMQSNTIQEKCDVTDESLPAVTASLELLTVDTNLPYPERKRAVRRKTFCIDHNESLNRRCSLRPRKRSTEMEKNDKQNKTQEVDVKNYYLNKNLKRKLNSLETIYEERDSSSENNTFMSVKRYKRMIQFQNKPTDCKLKKRRAKIKKVFGLNVGFKRRCASMQMLLDKLNGIRAESPTKIDNETK
ncbi:uncharacterized protein LOC117222324 [Megalopta genalis]|uniref:uncharacterized protein LOC117222324 n=1 Tax=Megalopta genalis TaxID=115081 RepID=UPI0014433680|nr:uncharacterized protein LOC117222324 [Megalopta genalis]